MHNSNIIAGAVGGGGFRGIQGSFECSIAYENVRLNPEDPDYQIEYFWYGLKHSMFNFYGRFKLPYGHIHEWSSGLNEMKSGKQYDKIEINIRDYIAKYAFDITKNETSTYHSMILVSNIKRWNKISNQFNFLSSVEHNKMILLFMIYLELKLDTKHQHSTLSPSSSSESLDLVDEEKFLTIEEVYESHNDEIYDDFIKYALTHKKIKILELLKNIPGYNVIENLKRLYPQYKDSIRNNMSLNKLCSLIASKQRRHTF